MSLRVAATLGLADRAGQTGATAESLARQTGASASVLRRLLDHLVTVGVFDRDVETGRYRVTDFGRGLRDDDPGGLRADLDITGWLGRAELAFVELLHTVRTGELGYSRRYGRGFWADLAATPQLRKSFDAKMNRRFEVQATQIAQRFDWGRFSHIVDVGGGDGTLLDRILRTHPKVRGSVLDVPTTAAAATERFAEAGWGERADAVAGSFFEPLPGGADAYVLSDILHDWDDDNARAILTECTRAAAAHGLVLVIEVLREGLPGQGFNTAIDLSMVVFFGGRERTIEEITALAGDCGLELRDTRRVADERTLLEFGIAEPREKT